MRVPVPRPGGRRSARWPSGPQVELRSCARRRNRLLDDQGYLVGREGHAAGVDLNRNRASPTDERRKDSDAVVRPAPDDRTHLSAVSGAEQHAALAAGIGPEAPAAY